MNQCGLLILAVLLAGCATALDRERQCFESVTAEYLTAQEELLQLDAAWRAATLVDDTARVDVRAAHQRLRDAQIRLRPALEWYERLYDRLRLRSEEEEMLADARLLLLTGPAALFYPVVRWNLHAVLWDGADPDAESDPVARYCADRLTREHMEPERALSE